MEHLISERTARLASYTFLQEMLINNNIKTRHFQSSALSVTKKPFSQNALSLAAFALGLRPVRL